MIKCDLGIKEDHNKRLVYWEDIAPPLTGGDRKVIMYVAGITLISCLPTEILSTEKNNCKITES